MRTLSLEKLRILKAKIKRLVATGDLSRIDFLVVLSSNNGFISPQSIETSFSVFVKRHSKDKYQKVLQDLKEDGLIIEKDGIQFALFDEKGYYDWKAGQELSQFTGECIFQHDLGMKRLVDELISEVEGNELLRCIAKRNSITYVDRVEPEIVKTIGTKSFQDITNRLVENNLLVEYASSSRKHYYEGFKPLPYLVRYVKDQLGIFELTDTEKSVLGYLACFSDFFDHRLYTRIDYSNEWDRKRLNTTSLHHKFLASLTYSTEQEILNTLDSLKKKTLVEEEDLGYTRGRSYRGAILKLTKLGESAADEARDEMKEKIEAKIKETFSDRESRIIYFLFWNQKIPLTILSQIRKGIVNMLLKSGLIGEKENTYLDFKSRSSPYETINFGIDTDEADRWLKEKCEPLLTKEEKLLLGFLCECKDVILNKYADWKSWSQVTARTRRNYEQAYTETFINFPHLKKLFSSIAGIPLEKTEDIVTDLEKNGFLIHQNIPRGFPGYIITYRIPVKFAFDLDFTALKQKVRNYVDFLSEKLEEWYNQLIFLDYLTQFFNAENFLAKPWMIKGLLETLGYDPSPKQYLPIYVFENGAAALHPLIRQELIEATHEMKSQLINSVKTLVVESTADYRDNILYSYQEREIEGYFFIEIESPDPSVGIVSFVLTPWVYITDLRKISELFKKSNTINLFVIYPNYPQLSKMVSAVDGNYNLFIVRKNTCYAWMKRQDSISKTVLGFLAGRMKIATIEDLTPKEGEKIGVGVIKEIPIAIGQMNKAENEIENGLRELEGNVIAMLDFIDRSTFGYLDSIPKECGIQIITSNIKEKERCRTRAERCAKDRPHFEVMEINKVHQRWIGSEATFFIEIGADLKSDALGRSNHTIRFLAPEAYKETIKRFHEFWYTKQRELRRIYGNDLLKTLFFSAKKEK